MTLGVLRLAVGREPHHLVLAGVDLEAGVVGEGGVEQAQRVGEVQLAVDREIGRRAQARRGRAPLADAVERQHQRLLERGGVEGGGRVAQVVLGKQQLGRPVMAGLDARELPGEAVLLEQLLLDPQRHRHLEGAKAARRERHVGLEQPLELQERLVVEGDVVELGSFEVALRPGSSSPRWSGKRGVVLPAREALLLRRRHDLAVDDEGGRTVMIERRDAENAHGD